LADIYGAPYILVRPFGDIPNTIKKCAKPTITYQNGKILFSCETEEVEYVYTCTTPASTSQTTSNEFTPSTQYIITVYAKKDGYLDSEPVTQEIDVRGLKGDVNDDGEVSIADINLVIGVILGGEADESVLQSADVNWDGEVTVADVNMIIDLILK
jgi:hypothetical protein